MASGHDCHPPGADEGAVGDRWTAPGCRHIWERGSLCWRATGAVDGGEAAQPVVVTSSRDEAPVPVVAGAVRFARAIEATGWTVRQTYAVADVPATSRSTAHRLHTVCVRFRRPGDFAGYAVWCRRDDGRWAYGGGLLGLAYHGLRELTARLTAVTEAVAA